MSDLLAGRIEPGVANAVCNAGGKLLRMVELQQRFGKAKAEEKTKEFRLLG